MSLIPAIEAIRHVRETNSKLAKQAILSGQVENEFLREFLRVCYEPHINFYIKKVDTKAGGTRLAWEESEPFTNATLSAVIATLAMRQKTGNEAKRWLADLYSKMDEDGQELLELLIQRDVKAGISGGTINKTWPGLVTDVPYMRCCLPKDTKLKEWPWEDGIYSEIKADGMFANVNIQVGGGVGIESRAGSPFPLDHFQDLVKEIQKTFPEGYQLHGELLMKAPDGKILAREVGNGMFNSLLKEGVLEEGYVPTYQVWDMIPLTQAVVKNKFKVPYTLRFHTLQRCFTENDQPKATNFIHLIEFKIVTSLKEAGEHAREAMLRGLEGTIIKHPDLIWEDSTSKFQVKLKLEMEVDLLVVGFNAADSKSKNADLFGSLECYSSDGLVRVGVTGLTDEKRKEIFEDRDSWIGSKIITVRANGLMSPSDKTNGYYSLFLPRFVEERLDKKQADSLDQIKAIQQAAIEMKDFV